MKIRHIDLGERPLLLAPMEDVTDIGFRLLCRRMGAAMVYSEFVAADALVRGVNRSMEKLTVCDEERPVAIQIYGKEPAAVRDAAQLVVEQAHPDVLDLNFGCPVKRVAGKGAGAGLLQDVPRMLAITRAVVDAVSVPVTVKTRLGWDQNSKIIVELAEQLQDQGIAALTIHGRTRSQMYTGEADWTLIGEVKRNPRMHIPVIGNGDITTAEAAKTAFERYGVDAVMVGRATFGRPWVFKEMSDLLHPGQRDVVTAWRVSTSTAASCISADTWPPRLSSKASQTFANGVSPCCVLRQSTSFSRSWRKSVHSCGKRRQAVNKEKTAKRSAFCPRRAVHKKSAQKNVKANLLVTKTTIFAHRLTL